MKYAYLMLGAAAFLAFSGCSSSSSGTDPNAVFDTIQNAVSSSMEAGGGDLTRRNIRGLEGEADPNCDEHGRPVDENGDELSNALDGYAAAFFYCLIKQPTDGPDTLLGAMAQAVSFACMISDKLDFSGEARQEMVSLDTDCFSQALLDDIGGPLTIDATITTSPMGDPAFGDANEWDYSVQLDFTDPEFDSDATLYFLFKVNGSVKAVAAKADVSNHENDGFTVFLDTDAGILRYESKHQRYGEDSTDSSSGFNRHNRILIQGTIDPDGTFTSVDSIQGASGDLYKQDADPANDHGYLVTMSGNPDAGFQTEYFGYSGETGSISDFSALVSACVGGSCTGVDGIPIEDVSDLEFLMYPGSPNLTTTTDWFEALAPLSYTSVTTADSQ